MPWWAAILIAVTATTIGFAFDAGSGGKELGGVFAVMYVLGCVAAVLAVRHSGIFTAVIQPPLLLFVAVPGAYFLFHGAKFTGLKDTLINCGYPLIERFPLMLFTSAAVLLIGMARWYYAMWTSVRTPAPAAGTAGAGVAAAPHRFGGLAAKFSSFFGAGSATGAEVAADTSARPRRKHGIDRPATAERRARPERSAQRPAPTRSRHARPPLDDVDEPPRERPRRQSSARQPDPARRRPRPPQEPGYRTPPPRRLPPEEREYRPRPPRGNRFEPYEPFEPYPPYEPPAPPRRRPPPAQRPSDLNGNSGTHHPVSRVRYRDSEYDR